MPIGSSVGMLYQDEFHMEASPWIQEPPPTGDNNIVTPNEFRQNKQMDDIEQTELGGIDVAMKVPQNQMPFPDNNNPDTDFNNRFPNLPKSGILNDLKTPPDPSPPLIRKISDIYDTPLTQDQQTAYSKKFSPEDSTDYDMKGYFQDHPDADPHTDGTHYPDTYKKPNHPTFSDESQYNGVAGNQGGTWGTEDGKDTFTPRQD